MLLPWTRLELDARDDTLREGLRAEVHDALWLLARQWQMGEFRGEDNGTPVLVRCRSAADAPQVLLAGGEALTLAPGGEPLEARIEREGPQPPDLYTRLLGARLFVDLLVQRGLAAVAKRCVLRFPALPGAGPGDSADDALLLAAAALPDSAALYAALVSDGPADGPAGVPALARALRVTRAQDAAFAAVAAQWQQWYGSRCGVGGGLAWAGADAAHHAALRTRGGVELVAAAHAGGALDWCALDARHASTGDTGTDDTSTGDAVALPATDAEFIPLPLQIPGTGSLRFWEMEDAQVDLSALAAGSTEVARMLLSEFALLWGHDWFSVPLPLPTGALARVQRLTVVDTFGVETDIAPADADSAGGFGLWRHAGLSAAAAGLWVPDGTPLGAPAVIERLDILFDEGSNMLWAVEARLCGALALPLEGPQTTQTAQAAAGVPAPPAPPALPVLPPGTWRYRPFTAPPTGWVPLAVVDGRLQVAELALGDLAPAAALRSPLAATLALRADVVSTAGLSLLRQWEVARRADGQLVAWIARRREAQPPSTTAALVFDQLER